LISLSLHEKIDLQEVEINEQTIVIDELRNEIHSLNNKDDRRQSKLPSPLLTKSTDDQQRIIEELDKKVYDFETERTCLVFEHERLKTNLDLCIDEKQHLIEQRTQTSNELRKLKLRILALQDQIHKLKRNNQPISKKNVFTPSSTIKKRIIKKKPKKTCLEVLLDQNQSSAFLDDLQGDSSFLYRMSSPRSPGFSTNRRQRLRRHRTCSLCDYHTEASLMKRKRRPSISSTIPKKRCNELVDFLIKIIRLFYFSWSIKEKFYY
jgi:hypothetical protein